MRPFVLFVFCFLREVLPCSLPPESLQWLPSSTPPCIHPGQLLLFLPSLSPSLNIRSPSISIHEDAILAERRLCFFDRPLVIPYEYSCEGREWRERWLRVAHPRVSTRRVKRWVRRRNPSADTIHFQQERYVKEMPEDAPTGSTVLSVKATHVSDEPLYYSMVAPQDSRSANIFTLDTVTGEIRLAKSLDRETLDKHLLKVTAYERLNPSVSTSSSVLIEVLDVQDNSPIFERDSYFAETREDAPVGTTVLSVFARDLDGGKNGEVEYSLDPKGEGVELLTVHPRLGVVQTAAPLDRETLPVMRLSVIARDKGDPPRQSTALIELTLIDVNDNSPVFDQEVYNVSVLENTTLPAVIAVISAKDKDAGVNGEVHYSLASSSSLPVTVDYSTGEVTLRSRIPLSDAAVSLLVRAKDGAQPAKSTTVPLYIQVIDINDHAPMFIAAQRELQVEEGLTVGEEIGRVFAIDDDIGENARIRYTMNGTSDFEIDEETGVMRTTTEIDRERTARYEIVVTATDGGDPQLSATNEMTIIVKDINDNAPVFDKARHTISLSEDSPRGTKVALLKATDADQDSKLTYRIEKATSDVFSLIDMGVEGALLSLASPLKTSEHESIQVEVSARDEGGLKGTTTVEILVDDVNSPPVFVPQPFSVHIAEDAEIGSVVTTMKAEDSDRGDNAVLSYSLCEECSKDFEINSTTGIIIVSSSLDRETRNSYVLTVEATDSASPPLSSTTSLEIIIDDVNDKAPAFSSLNYTASISEDIAIGTSFLQVYAIDEDEGENALLDYYLNESSPVVQRDLFRLDRTSGTLRVNAKLDREEMARVELPIYARDRGKPSLSSSSLVTLTLTDVNDNAPKFEQTNYELSLTENSPAGTVVGTISATDADEGDNAKIEFRIFGGSDARFFDIVVDDDEPNAVKILSRVPFDYEAKTNTFHVEIQASSGQLSSTAAVKIRLSDVNDNRPQLKDFLVYIVSHEDRPTLGDIGTMPAFDADQSASLDFSLSENDLLGVEKTTGKMFVKRVWRSSLDAALDACVSDGPNTVCAKCRLVYVFVRSSWLAEAVSVRIERMNEDSFWDPPVFARFRQGLSTLSDWRESDILPLTVHSVADKSLDVSFVVRHKQRVVKWWKVRELLDTERTRVQRLIGSTLSLTNDESCSKEPCPYFQQCRNTLKFIDDAHRHETDNFLALTLHTLTTFSCECPDGFTTSPNISGSCNARIDLCYSNPCQNNGSCIPLESAFRCECQEGWRGETCEIPTRSHTCSPGYCKGESRCELREGRMNCEECQYNQDDTDERCSLRTVSFDGKGAVRVEEQLGRVQWAVEMRFATIHHDGLLFSAGERGSDYIEVSLEGRLLKAEFSVGGETNRVVKMKDEKKNRVNDGEWHTVVVGFHQRRLSLSLDDCDRATSGRENSRQCSVEGEIGLPPKCADPSVPCFRFLDIPTGIFVGGKPTKSRDMDRPFNGCIGHFSVDKRTTDFADSIMTERIGVVHDGCAARREKCEDDSCEGGKCRERWNGLQCGACHGKNCHGESTKSYSLFDEESFIVFRPSAIASPFDLSFSFRSSKSFSQLLAIEFDIRSLHFALHIEDGLLRASFGTNSTHLTAPELNPAHWTKLTIDFRDDSIVIAVDGLYSTTLPLSQDLHIKSIYTGLAPSTNHPSIFEGCVKGMMLNGEELSPSQQGKTRHGCTAQNRCSIDGVCPLKSRCHREWEKHHCECLAGFFGDSCRPSCSLKGICGSNGLCQPANNTRGYECECPADRWGANCEWTRPVRECPKGWWGVFPHCKMCDCSSSQGFLLQCHEQTGRCLCPKDNFLSSNRCTPCGCGPASISTACSSSGQCECLGEARGLKCDRCLSPFHILDVSSAKCSPLKNACPAQIEEGIVWPTTRMNMEARVACPSPQTGVASRRCGSDSLWKEVQRFNCTLPAFNDLLSKMPTVALSEIIFHLANATSDISNLEGRNLLIGREAFLHLFDHSNSSFHRELVSDERELSSLIAISSSLLPHSPPLLLYSDLRRILQFGRSLLSLHDSLVFLPPVQIATDNLLFSIDDVSSSRILPKFDAFLDLRPSDFPDARIELYEEKRLFYMITRSLSCTQCESSIVGVSSHSSSVRIAFPLKSDSRWKHPECMHQSHGTWSSSGAVLISLNTTHALCEFARGEGIFTITSAQQHSNVLRVSHISLSYSIFLYALSALFLLTSVIVTLCRATIATRLIRVGFSLSLLLEAVVVVGLQKVYINELFCPVRNALLSLASCSPFAWLFLYSLHIYRLLSEGVNNSSAIVSLLIGVVFPCIFSTISFLLTSSCSIHFSSWLFWILLAPISLFLVLSFYSSVTSLLLSGDKQYQLYVVGHRLRRALLQHAILTVMTTCFTMVGVFLSACLGDWNELLCSVLLILISIATLLWSYTLGSRGSENGESPAYGKAALWLQDEKREEEAKCQSPLVVGEEMEDKRWVQPDVVPIMTHGIERNPPTILSPATQILKEGPGYGNGSSTLVRLTSNEDYLDNAYYTYSRRYNSSTFSRT